MATVRMKKGNVYADIYDSPEGIARAESHGFVRCEEKPVRETKVEEAAEEKTAEKAEKPKTSRTKRQ